MAICGLSEAYRHRVLSLASLNFSRKQMGNAMWKCRECDAELDFEEIDPEVDSHGLHFICPECGHRNKLVNIGKPDGPIELVQPDS